MRKIYYLIMMVLMLAVNFGAYAQDDTQSMKIVLKNPEHIKEITYDGKAIKVAETMEVTPSWMKDIPLIITPNTGCSIDSWNVETVTYGSSMPGKKNSGRVRISVLLAYAGGTLTVYTSKVGEEKKYDHLTFNVDPETQDAISAVKANGQSINDWEWSDPAGFDVPENADMEIVFNTIDYHLDLFQINGVDTNNYKFKSSADMTLDIKAHRYGNFVVTLVGNPQHYVLYSDGTTLTSRNPANIVGSTCLVDEKRPYLWIERAPGFKLTSVMDENGEPVPVGEAFTVKGNMTLNFLGEELVYDRNLVVFLYNANLAEDPSIVTEDRRSFALEEGYQTINFAAEDNIVSLMLKNADGKDKVNTAYHNDESVKGNDFAWTFNYIPVQHNDVLLAFVGSEPRKHTINIGSLGEAPFAVLRHDVLETEDPSEFEMYNGTKFSIIPTSDAQIKVRFGSAEAEIAAMQTRAGEGDIQPDEQGAFHFNVTGPISLIVEDLVPTAVNEIEATGNASKAIYNLQGIRVNGDASNLPAGIYVIDGKKVQLRK